MKNFNLQLFAQSITLTSGADNYENTTTDKIIYALGGNDSIVNNKNSVTIFSGVGDDTIKSNGSYVKFDGGDGNDRIFSCGVRDTLIGGNGNDTIENNDNYSRIDGGAGNDYIVYATDGVFPTITSGAGQDKIWIKYTRKTGMKVTDNYVTITDLDETDVLSLGANSQITSAQFSNNYLTFKVQNNYDIRVYLPNISNINQLNNMVVEFNGSTTTLRRLLSNTVPTWNISGTTAKVTFAGDVAATITGLKNGVTANDLSLNGNIITVSSNALGTGTVKVTGNYDLVLADNVAEPQSHIGWNVSNGTAKYNTAGNTSGYVLSSDKKSITYKAAVADKTAITVSGLSENANADGLSLSGKVVTLKSSALGSNTVKVSGNYTLALDSSVRKSDTKAARWTFSYNRVDGDYAEYHPVRYTEGYSLSSDKKSVTYRTTVDDKVLVKVTGLSSGANESSLSLSGTVVTLKPSALLYSTVEVSEGYSLALASNVEKPKTINPHWTISSSGEGRYLGTGNTDGYILSDDKKSVSYKYNKDGELLAIVKHLKPNANKKYLTLKGNVITVSQNALAKYYDPSIEYGDYIFALASDVKKSKTIAAGWTVAGTKATYKTERTTEGWVFSNSERTRLSYNSDGGGSTLVTVTGLKNGAKASALKLEGNTVTLSKAALGTTTVKVNNNFKLALADDVAGPSITAGYWIVEDTTAKYISEKTTAGYTLSSDKKSVTYTKASGGTNVITLKGLQSGLTADNFSIQDKTIKLSADMLDSNGVSVNGKGYNFELTGAGKLTNVGAAASLSGSSGNDTLVGGTGADYLTDTTGDNILTGGKGNDTFVCSTGNDTITDYTVGQDKIKLFYDKFLYNTYVAKIKGNDVIISTYQEGSLTIKNGRNKKLNINDVIKTYSVETIEGSSGNDTLIGGNYADYLYGGNGDDIFTGGKGNDIFFSSYGHDTITDYTAGQDKIKFYCENYHDYYAYVKGNDVIIMASSGSDLTIKNGRGKKLNINGTIKTYSIERIIGGGGNDTLTGGNYADYLDGDHGDDILTGGKGNDTFACYAGNDTITDYTAGQDKIKLSNGDSYYARVKGNDVIITVTYENTTLTIKNGRGKKLNINGVDKTYSVETILGSAGNDTLVGGNYADYLYGGNGDDILTGGKGNDIFVYFAGNDTITDYTSGQDKIMTGVNFDEVKISGNDVILYYYDSFKDNGSLRIKNAKGKQITFIDEQNQSRVYKKTYTKSSNLLWFDDDNAFATADNISNITSEKPVAEFENNQTEKVTQENLITYAK